MAAKLGDAVLFLSTQNQGLQSGLQEAEGQVQQSGGRLSGFMTGIAQGVGQMATGMLVGAAQGLVSSIGQSISKASDLNETISKVNVVFKEGAPDVLKWGDSAATALGMSKNTALSAAGTFGALFSAMGMSTGKSKEMSTGLVQLAADLASFNNLDPTVVLEKLRSGLTGETEPLKSLGVNISAVQVEAKALSMGLVTASVDMTKVNGATLALKDAQAGAAEALKKHGEGSDEYAKAQQKVSEAEDRLKTAMEGKIPPLTAAQKAEATYALITEQTATAQGDFARTSDGLANQQRIQQAQTEDLQAAIGQGLLPIQLELTKSYNELLNVVLPPLVDIIKNQVTPAVQGLVDWFKSLSPETKELVVGIAALTVGLLVLLPVLGMIGAGMAAISWPVLAVIAVVGLLAVAWAKDWGGIQEKTTSVVAFLKGSFDGLVWGINLVWATFLGWWAWVQGIANGTIALNVTAPEWIVSLVAWVWPALPTTPEAWVTTLMAWLWPVLGPVAWVTTLMTWLWPDMVDEPGWVEDLIDWAWPKFPGKPDWLTDLLNWVWPSLPSLPSWLGGCGGGTESGTQSSDTVTGSSVDYSVGRMGRGLVGTGRAGLDRLGQRVASAGSAGGAAIYVTVNVNSPIRSDLDLYKLGRRVGSEVARRER